MKYITGFFMAWGCFTSIPCPCKKWNESSRKEMLLALPFIGAILGCLWLLLTRLLLWLCIGPGLAAASFVLILGALHGFIHTDGFMDCCDAIFSRRSLEERQRILKDSSVGAFAVIGLVLVHMTCFGAAYDIFSAGIGETAFGSSVFFVLLIVIPVVSRAGSSLAILNKKPMAHSQYSAISRADNATSLATSTPVSDSISDATRGSDAVCNFGSDFESVCTTDTARGSDTDCPTGSDFGSVAVSKINERAIYNLVIVAFMLLALAAPAVAAVAETSIGGLSISAVIAGNVGTEAISAVIAGTAVLVVEVIAYTLACQYASRNLGGMSGDISGFAITISEAAAVITMGILA